MRWAIHLCTGLGRTETTDEQSYHDAKWLVQAKVNLQDNHGVTALMYALSRKKLNTIKLILAHGDKSTVNLAIQEGLFPLHMAVYENNFEMTQLVLQRGANPNPITLMQTPLCIAVDQNNIAMVKLLLKYGACVQPNASEGNLTLQMVQDKSTFLEE